MSKYKVGDKFIIEIAEVFESEDGSCLSENNLYRLTGFKSLVMSDSSLDRLEPINTPAKAAADIQIGDEVEDRSSGTKFFVTRVREFQTYGFSSSGEFLCSDRKYLKKTGNHIDLPIFLTGEGNEDS